MPTTMVYKFVAWYVRLPHSPRCKIKMPGWKGPFFRGGKDSFLPVGKEGLREILKSSGALGKVSFERKGGIILIHEIEPQEFTDLNLTRDIITRFRKKLRQYLKLL